MRDYYYLRGSRLGEVVYYKGNELKPVVVNLQKLIKRYDLGIRMVFYAMYDYTSVFFLVEKPRDEHTSGQKTYTGYLFDLEEGVIKVMFTDEWPTVYVYRSHLKEHVLYFGVGGSYVFGYSIENGKRIHKHEFKYPGAFQWYDRKHRIVVTEVSTAYLAQKKEPHKYLSVNVIDTAVGEPLLEASGHIVLPFSAVDVQNIMYSWKNELFEYDALNNNQRQIGIVPYGRVKLRDDSSIVGMFRLRDNMVILSQHHRVKTPINYIQQFLFGLGWSNRYTYYLGKFVDQDTIKLIKVLRGGPFKSSKEIIDIAPHHYPDQTRQNNSL